MMSDYYAPASDSSKPANVFDLLGQACRRFGGNIPLIGFTPWGVVWNQNNLAVAEKTINYGYTARQPINYNFDTIPEPLNLKFSHLQENHSHFVLVDNKTIGKYGTEIDLRGAFERCVCAEPTEASKSSKQLMEKLKEQKLGWDGGSEGSGKELREQGRAVCLCFEGGPGTVGTVEASIKNRTPVLVIHGTGRAADLIADCLDVFAEKQGTTDQGAAQGAVVGQGDEQRERIAKLLTNKEGDAEDLQKLFGEYKIWIDKKPSELEMTKMAEQLRYIVESHMCLAYTLGETRPGGINGMDRIPVGIHEYIARCAMLGIDKDFSETEKIGFAELLRASSESLSVNASPIRPRNSGMVKGGSLRSIGRSCSGLGWTSKPSVVLKDLILDPAKMDALHMCKLALLIEWGQTEMVDSTLRSMEQGFGGQLPKRLLNRLLHLALLHNQADIAAAALRRGANLDWYDPANQLTDSIEPGSWEQGVWVDLLHGASDEPHERYLLTLAKLAQRELTNSGRLPPGAVAASVNLISVKNDDEALAILDEVYVGVTMADQSSFGRRAIAPELHFTHDSDSGSRMAGDRGAWGGGDSNLFLFAVLVNRPGLAKLFFIREARHNADKVLNNALWACLLSRRLRDLPDVGRLSNNLRNGFDTTASYYEKVAANVLHNAFERSDQFALGALELPLKRCKEWTALDLVIKADCRAVIAKCPELCIAAVQRRFYGEGGFRVAIRRNAATLRGVLDFVLRGVDETDQPRHADKRGRVLTLQKPSIVVNWLSLALCVVVDMIGASYYLFPLLPGAFYTFFWSPICAFWVYRLLNDPCMALFAITEETLPIISLFPTATVGWVLQQENENERDGDSYPEKDNEVEEDSPFVPVDHFVLDIVMHCILTCLMTALLLLPKSPILRILLEIVIVVLIILDEIPDIIFSGLAESDQKKTVSVSPQAGESPANDDTAVSSRNVAWDELMAVIARGFGMYLKDSGYSASVVWALLMVCGSHAKLDWSSLFYGLAAGLMWLRTLNFLLVQPDLGQFVRVLQNMAKDLGFFGLVWAILVLAFSAFMLGATVGSQNGAHGNASDESETQPMQGWPLWWFLRTYLQSLGQDYIEEMSTGPSNVVFLLMWPIFNVLLVSHEFQSVIIPVNLLVAVMGDRYDAAKEESQIAYCMDLYSLDSGIRSKGHTNAPAFLLAVARNRARSNQSATTAQSAQNDVASGSSASTVWSRLWDAPALLTKLLISVMEDLKTDRKRPPPDQLEKDALQVLVSEIQRIEQQTEPIDLANVESSLAPYKAAARRAAARNLERRADMRRFKDLLVQACTTALNRMPKDEEDSLDN